MDARDARRLLLAAALLAGGCDAPPPVATAAPEPTVAPRDGVHETARPAADAPHDASPCATLGADLLGRPVAGDADRSACLQRLGLRLAMPPLRPPAMAPANGLRIADDTRESVLAAAFAAEAGIVVVRTGKRLRVLDTATGASLFDEYGSNHLPVAVSANGRVMTTAASRSHYLRDTATGEILLEFDTRAHRVSLPDARTLVHTDLRGAQPVSTLVDLRNGRQVPLDMVPGGVHEAIAARFHEDSYVLMGVAYAARVNVDRDADPPSVRVIEARDVTAHGFRPALQARSRDGRFLVGAEDGIALFDVDRLRRQDVALPASVAVVAALYPTEDEDLFLVRALADDGSTQRHFLLSLAQRTLTPTVAGLQQELAWVPAWQQVATFDGQWIRPLALVQSDAEAAPPATP